VSTISILFVFGQIVGPVGYSYSAE